LGCGIAFETNLDRSVRLMAVFYAYDLVEVADGRDRTRRHCQRVVALVDRHRDVRGHPWAHAVERREADGHRVGHDVVDDRGRTQNGGPGSLDGAVGERVEGDNRALPGLDASGVCFAERCTDRKAGDVAE